MKNDVNNSQQINYWLRMLMKFIKNPLRKKGNKESGNKYSYNKKCVTFPAFLLSKIKARNFEFLVRFRTREIIKHYTNESKPIYNYSIHKTEKEIKQFIGLVRFHCKCIPNFSDITKPLTNCRKKAVK